MPSEKILVALDGDPPAEAALQYAESLALATASALHLVSVIKPPAHGGRRTGCVARARYLDATAAALRGRGFEVSTLVVAGVPAERIIATGAHRDVRMIVMTTRGRGGVERWLQGSVADEVMRGSGRSVLLVHAHEGQMNLAPFRLRRLLVPLDGSALAETALGPAVELAEACIARLTLVRVEPWFPPYAADDEYRYVAGQGAKAPAMQADERYLRGVRERLPVDLNVDLHVLRGDPVVNLLIAFEHEQPDLVVMDTHAHDGLRRLVAGGRPMRSCAQACRCCSSSSGRYLRERGTLARTRWASYELSSNVVEMRLRWPEPRAHGGTS